MSKTPVSILQEMMMKNQIMPNYELIHDGGGTHVNTFIYQVTCDGLRASGSGRSKKDAKHEAAKAMLEAIAAHRAYPQLPAAPAESPVRTPLPQAVPEVQRIPPSEPFVNAVGSLQDLCVKNNLSEPEYVQISDVGPPHEKVFSIQCKVTTFVETGVARTKKQAKQEAAKKMFDKLVDLIPELSKSNEDNEKLDKENTEIRNKRAKFQYITLSKSSTVKKVNLGVKVSDYHSALKNSIDDEVQTELIDKLESLIPESHVNSIEFIQDLLIKLKDILAIVNLDISVINLQPNDSATCMAALKINSTPDIVQIASGETQEEAMFNAILKLINTTIFFLK